jgi:hypothetical protein
MKILEKITGFLYGIKVLFQDFFSWGKKQVSTLIAILALAVWFMFYFASGLFGTETFPIGYFQKIPFGLLVACVGLGSALLWLKYGRPDDEDKLNNQTDGGIKELTEWQKVQIGLFWISAFLILYVIGVVAL